MITAIFDLDGTIADTIADLGDAVNCGLTQLGCPVHGYEAFSRSITAPTIWTRPGCTTA